MDRGRRQRSRLLTGLPTLLCLLDATWRAHEIHVYAALCSAPSEHGVPMGPRHCKAVGGMFLSKVSARFPWVLGHHGKVPEQDSGSLGARVCAPIHPASHSFIQDLLTAGDK